MTLVLTPFGRGRWHRVIVTFDGRRAPRDPILRFRIGDSYPVGGTVYRIAGVFV